LGVLRGHEGEPRVVVERAAEHLDERLEVRVGDLPDREVSHDGAAFAEGVGGQPSAPG